MQQLSSTREKGLLERYKILEESTAAISMTSGEEGSQSDEDLVRSVTSGNRELFRELVERHGALVYSSILRQVASPHIAEDLAQETFAKAFIGLKSYRFEAKFSTWLLRIGLNTVSTYFASRNFRERQRTISFEFKKHDLLNVESPEVQQERRKNLHDYQIALGRLPKHLREVLVLCGFESKSYQEVATLLNIPIGTVRSRLNKARLKMRSEMAEIAARGEL